MFKRKEEKNMETNIDQQLVDSTIISSNNATTSLPRQSRYLEHRLLRNVEFQKIIADISSNFVGIIDLDISIKNLLSKIAIFSDASRAYLFIINNNEETMNNTHEWCGPEVTPQIDNLQNLPTKTFPWWMKKLNEGETILIKKVSELSPYAAAEKIILEQQDIYSIIVLPVNIQNKLIGFIGFDNVDATKMWTRKNFNILKISSEILANAINRSQIEKELETQKKRVFIANSILRHDISNHISMISSAIANYYKNGDKEMLEEICKQVEKSNSIINLQYKRETFFKNYPHLKEFDLKKVFNKILINMNQINISFQEAEKVYADDEIYLLFEKTITFLQKIAKKEKLDISFISQELYNEIKISCENLHLPNNLKEQIHDKENHFTGNDDPELSLYEIKSIIKEYDGEIDFEEDNNRTIFILRLKKVVII